MLAVIVDIHRKIMNDDNILLLFAYVVYWLTLVGLSMKSRSWKQTLTVNLVVHIAYSTFLLYRLVYESRYGSGLIWWFYLLVSIGVHWLINLMLLLKLSFFQKRLSDKIE